MIVGFGPCFVDDFTSPNASQLRALFHRVGRVDTFQSDCNVGTDTRETKCMILVGFEHAIRSLELRSALI